MKLLIRRSKSIFSLPAFVLFVFVVSAGVAAAQTPSPALLILEKADSSLAIVDPAMLKIVGRVPAGPDPHEIVASPDGKTAYISNYGGLDSNLNTLSVVDLQAQKALPAVSLGALHSAHGLDFAGGKVYFSVETNKAIGRYDPATQSIDWVLGTGQDRTHMVLVSPSLERIFTANVNSGTISIIEQVAAPGPPPGFAPLPGAPPPGPSRTTWHITNVASGRGSEGFDVSPDGKELWAANADDNTVTVIDVAAKRAVAAFPVRAEHGNRLKFTPDGKHVLITGLGGRPGAPAGSNPNLVVIDAATRKEVKGFALGGGSAGILVLPDGSRAFVAVSSQNKVVAIDLHTWEVVGTIPTGKSPDGLAWAKQPAFRGRSFSSDITSATSVGI